MSNTSAWIESGAVTIQTVRKNYHLGGQLVATRRGDEVYFIHGDHPSASLRTSLGSTSLTTDISGTVVAQTRYLPYGEERWTGGGTQPTDFTGQRVERGFGLMDYQARYYDPRLGRFVSADTVVPEPGNPQALNRYSYVNSSPVRYDDPSGHGAPLPPCVVCQVKIDISNWSDLAKDLAVVGSFLTGFHVDREQNLITGPTEQEWLESSVTDMVNPIGMVTGPGARVGTRVLKEGIEEVTEAAAQRAAKEGAERGFRSFARRNFRENLMYLTGKSVDEVTDLQAHHVLPDKFDADFASLGLNIHDPRFGAWVGPDHQKWSRAYNEDWRSFLRQIDEIGQEPTVEQVFEQAERMAQQYGFDWLRPD